MPHAKSEVGGEVGHVIRRFLDVLSHIELEAVLEIAAEVHAERAGLRRTVAELDGITRRILLAMGPDADV